MSDLLVKIGFGVVGGLVYSVAGLIGFGSKKITSSDVKEKFSGTKVVKAVLIGAIAGGVAGYLDIPIEDGVPLILANASFTLIIDKVATAVYRLINK